MKKFVPDTIKPHTIRKFELIEKYVEGWAYKILGLSTSKGVVFIDCMCNCGYGIGENEEKIMGTPVRVAKCLNQVMQKPEFANKKVYLFYNDMSQAKIDILKKELSAIDTTKIKITYSCTDGNDFLRQFDMVEFKGFNKLLFYDPYHAAIKWDAITPFLNSWAEVVINHVVMDTSRGVAQVRDETKKKKYIDTYQQAIEDLVEICTDKTALDNLVKKIIRDKSDNKTDVHLASFPFYNQNNGLVYNLIYYSKSIIGFRLFKKTAWKVSGDKSTVTVSHHNPSQFAIDFDNEGSFKLCSDKNAYSVSDIVSYIYAKYGKMKEVRLEQVYADLDNHPIFPCEGYKPEIKKLLAQLYGAKIGRDNIIHFQ
ncbi:three-Cys-motif partner protein TcmP [Christensenella tenuis]|uniref:Three-Cys-motif partner protein TcmP n=1 Tax=Christensenella tenuis TaxID=2763033 RepID=A0ABR7EFW0_9FIRM|nr:three-Cys-motif partner protein TcmP [Christensenella tenuis]MBC5648648.1 three-Cys-motif partner protein TcmP [Christensenella tenuis]